MASGALLLLKKVSYFPLLQKRGFFFSFTTKNVSCLSNVGGGVFLPILIES